MTKRRLCGVLFGTLLLVLGLGSPGSTAAPGTPKVAWSPCHRDFGPFECGTVQVPLDYDGPDGGAISIAVVRLPASDPARRIGSLFLNPGGPGGSGFDVALFAAQFLYSNEVRSRFDIVGFDPRGVIRSSPLRCFGNDKQWAPFFTPFAFPVTDGEEAIWEAADRALTDRCDQRAGRIASHISTANVARDLDALRSAVGDDKLTYVGYSYGSAIGLQYANLFPGNVRALVVDGVLDPVAWTTGTGNGTTVPMTTRLGSHLGAQATLEEFFRLCDAGTCAFGPGSASRFAALAAKLTANPVPFGYSILIAITLGALYDSSGWEDFAQLLADIESAAAKKAALAPARQAAVTALLERPLYVTKRAFPANYENFFESFPGVVCADSVNPTSYSAWSSAADSATGYFGRLWTWTASICAVWTAKDDDRYIGPFNRFTANPVLVVGNRFDPATPYSGAVTAAGLLPNSRLLTVNGWGHTSLFLSACADDAINRYLLTSVPPPVGTTCNQDFTPFAG
jgi:pimeloyl-ACP methyl ester carboxylesterase